MLCARRFDTVQRCDTATQHNFFSLYSIDTITECLKIMSTVFAWFCPHRLNVCVCICDCVSAKHLGRRLLGEKQTRGKTNSESRLSMSNEYNVIWLGSSVQKKTSNTPTESKRSQNSLTQRCKSHTISFISHSQGYLPTRLWTYCVLT